MNHRTTVLAVALTIAFGTLIPAVPSEAEAASGWGTAEFIDRADMDYANTPSVAMDSDGNAFAVWRQFDGVSISVIANRYVAGEGWTAPQFIETSSIESLSGPSVVVDSNGNATAVWSQYNGAVHLIRANQYTPGVGWGYASVVQSITTQSGSYPSAAVDGQDNVFAVWAQYDGVRSNVYAGRYVPGIGWEASELIEEDDTGSSSLALPSLSSVCSASTMVHGSRGPFSLWSSQCRHGSGQSES